MTNVDILFRYAAPPSEAGLSALAGTRKVYGIRKLVFDRDAKTLLVEYDATRLTGPIVAGLVRRAGLDIVEELPLIPPPVPKPAGATEAPATALKA